MIYYMNSTYDQKNLKRMPGEGSHMLLTVEDVMVRDVVAISCDENVKNAASTMIGFEIGSLVVSTPVLPRYKIGDQILAFRPPYYRCIGRERWWTSLRYGWDELRTMNLGRL